MALSRLSWSQASRAESESDGGLALPVVRVLVAGDAARVKALSEALGDPFRRARIELRFERASRIEPAGLLEPAAEDGSARAVLAFDLSRSDRALLYLTDRGRTRVFVRQLELSEGFDEVTLERLVIAARTSVSAILAGESIGLTRQDYERSLRSPPPTPKQPTPKRVRTLSIGSRYEARWLAGSMPAHGPGLMVSSNGERFALGVTVSGHLPWRYQQGDIGLRLVTLGSALSAELRQAIAPGWRASASLGLGLDVTQVEPLALRPGVSETADGCWVLDPFARAQLGLWHTWPSVWLGAFTGLDLEFVRARYTVDRNGQRETLLSPNVVRPLLALGFGTTW